MHKIYNLHILFDRFIADTKSGRRLKKNGSRFHRGTIIFYETVRTQLIRFAVTENFSFVFTNPDSAELKAENAYWKLFYERYSNYLFNAGSYDNYVGQHFKVLRTFFAWLKSVRGIPVGDIAGNFYVRHETIPVIVIPPERLRFLISNTEFEHTLPGYLRQTKDIFVFGCTVALRFSDLMHLTKRNIERNGCETYLQVRSIKTATNTRIKLPDYAVAILNRYKQERYLLPRYSNNRLNLNLKELCERAGWLEETGKERERRGIYKKITKNGKPMRFCDLITTHTMRRTAITTLLIMGMPENMVRTISGHAPMSKEFYKYVTYAQQYINNETDRIFSNLSGAQKPDASANTPVFY